MQLRASSFISILIHLLASARGDYILRVQVHSYSNPTNRCVQCHSSTYDTLHGCCDSFSLLNCVGEDRCDNEFFCCVRPLGTPPPQRVYNNELVESRASALQCLHPPSALRSATANDAAPIDFTSSTFLGVPNPMEFVITNTSRWEGIQLYLDVLDREFNVTPARSDDELVDIFLVNIEPDTLTAGLNKTTPQPYNGIFSFAFTELSFQLECLLGFIGNDCIPTSEICTGAVCSNDGTCVPNDTGFTCNCTDDFTGERCEISLSSLNALIIRTAVVVNGTNLVLNWQPPPLSDGPMLSYTVRITLYSNGERISEDSTMETTYTAKNLDAGVPYNVSIVPVNSYGEGSAKTATYFTQELTPNVAVGDVMVERTSLTTMGVSWTRLTLSEARGFVTFYIVAYASALDQQSTLFMNVDADSSHVTITGLEGDLSYSLQVLAATSAGVRNASDTVVTPPALQSDAPAGFTPFTSATIGAIIGGVVAFILVVAAITIAIIVAIRIVRGRQQNRDTTERDLSLDQCPVYSTIPVAEGREMRGSRDEYSSAHECPVPLDTSSARPREIKGAQEDFSLRQCAAYSSVPGAGGREITQIRGIKNELSIRRCSPPLDTSSGREIGSQEDFSVEECPAYMSPLGTSGGEIMETPEDVEESIYY